MKKVAILALLAAIVIACQSTENKTVSTTDSTAIEADSMAFESAIQDTFTTDSVN
jgi:uncharacterized protein YcfL